MSIDSNLPGLSLAAIWFDGRTARRIPVSLQISADTVRVIVGDGESASLISETPIASVSVGARIGNTPYRLQFPDGGLAVTSEHATVESAFHVARKDDWVARLERASAFVVVAMVGLGVAVYFAYRTLIPILAEAVAHRIPREAEKTLGAVALQGMDRWMLKTSRLEAAQLALVRKVFDELAERANLTDQVELQFREMAPNALALPGGTVVVTDGLVILFKSDERLLAGVIAHELGHIDRRHSLRHLLEGSASALLVGALMGDVSGVSALATSAPLVLSTLHYTREAEAEADQYAFALLARSGRSPKDFADAMRRFEAMETCLALRDKDLETGKNKTWKIGDPTDDEQIEVDEPDGSSSTSSGRARCLSEPEQRLTGREADVAKLQNDRGPTGYLHTHPVTQERIRAAEAATGK